MAARGAFITIEGVEGVGKSTSLEAIARYLESRGVQALVTREPGGTPLGEQLRGLLLDAAGKYPISAQTETLLMFAARAQHLKLVILPALERGDWVVCDRFTDATFAYQGGGRGVDFAFLDCLRAGVQGGLEPDLTLLLDAPIEVGRARIAAREPDRFERESVEFFERVRRAYLDLALQHPRRIKRIEAAESINTVKRTIEAVLSHFVEEFAP